MVLILSALLLGTMQTGLAQNAEAAPRMVTVLILPGRCRVSIDGRPATLEELRIAAHAWSKTQPEINFRPDPQVRYQCVDHALRILKEEGATNLGFVGNGLAE